MRYRSDVDGLRAVAVISVVLFHAGLPQFGGGFIGVDIFFVISGYLITTLILHDLKTHPVQQVFLHARWALYAEGNRYKQEPGDPAFLTPDRKFQKDWSVFEALLLSTVRSLRRMPVRITIIGSVPEMGVDVPRVVLREADAGSPFAVGTPFSDFTKRQERVFELFARLARHGVGVAHPHEVLCEGTWCSGGKRRSTTLPGRAVPQHSWSDAFGPPHWSASSRPRVSCFILSASSSRKISY